MSELSDALATALSEPRYAASIEDYYAWLREIGPHKVQEIIDDYEAQALALGDDLTFDNLPPGGLRWEWEQFCKTQNWRDRAFTESDKRELAELLASIEREAEAELEAAAGSGQT